MHRTLSDEASLVNTFGRLDVHGWVQSPPKSHTLRPKHSRYELWKRHLPTRWPESSHLGQLGRAPLTTGPAVAPVEVIF